MQGHVQLRGVLLQGRTGFFIQRPKKIEDAAQADVTLPRPRRALQ